jgi:hypothetical protein
VLGLFGGVGAAALLTEVPEETAGPYPGDGSNGPNVLDDSGIVRSDMIVKTSQIALPKEACQAVYAV